MTCYARTVALPFDGEDGYTENVQVEFNAIAYDDGIDIDEENIKAYLDNNEICLNDAQREVMIDKLYDMTDDILQEMARDMEDYFAEGMSDPF